MGGTYEDKKKKLRGAVFTANLKKYV